VATQASWHLQQQLQSVLNAAARLIYRLGFHNHITDNLTSLHWLRVPERVKYKVAVLQDSTTLRHVTLPLVPVADIPGRRALRSTVTDRLEVPSVRLHTVGNRAFPVAAPKI